MCELVTGQFATAMLLYMHQYLAPTRCHTDTPTKASTPPNPINVNQWIGFIGVHFHIQVFSVGCRLISDLAWTQEHTTQEKQLAVQSIHELQAAEYLGQSDVIIMAYSEYVNEETSKIDPDLVWTQGWIT